MAFLRLTIIKSVGGIEHFGPRVGHTRGKAQAFFVGSVSMHAHLMSQVASDSPAGGSGSYIGVFTDA